MLKVKDTWAYKSAWKKRRGYVCSTRICILLLIFSLSMLATLVPTLEVAQALEISVSPAKVVNGEYYIVKGDTIQINLSGNANENVDASITCKFSVDVRGGIYEYELKDFPIPVDVNSVVIKSYYVRNLKIEVPVFIFSYSKEKNANENGVATILINRSIGKGQYTIKISGNSNDTTVTIEATVNSAIALDQDGKYSLAYDTSKLPVGDLIVNAGGETIRAHVVESENEIPQASSPATPTPTPTTTTPTPTPTPTPEPTPPPAQSHNSDSASNPTPTPTLTVSPSPTTPTATKTPTPTPTPFEVTADMLTILHVNVTITESDGIYYVNVQLTLPNSCYRVLWGSVESSGNEFFGDAKVLRLSNQCAQVLTEFKHSYNLGRLQPGKYGFTFRIAGEKIKFVEFTVPTKSETSLSKIEVSIEPKSVKAKPGERINYTITLNWEPKEWVGLVNVSVILTAAGFEKEYELPQISTNGLTPPVSRQISLEIPRDIPPMTYSARLVVSADSVNASDEATLSVSTPGFEAIFGVVAAIIALIIRRLDL